MSPSSDREFSPNRAPTAAEEAALAWVVRCDRGLSDEQQQQFAEWLEADSHHRELFEEFGGTWEFMSRAPAERLSATTASATVPTGSVISFEYRRQRRSRHWLPLAAAAAIALAAVGGWQLSFKRENSVATAVGAMRELVLDDGSVVELNTDSAVVTRFTPTERRVQLTRGEAYFRVAKNPARPFIVEAGRVGVRALGTEFNVHLRADGVEVLVTEGRVRVAPEASSLVADRASTSVDSGVASVAAELGAGERVVVSPVRSVIAPALEVAKIPADEVQRRLAWQERRLEFSDTPLSEMVAEFNRYHRHKLVVTDPQLAVTRFGGSFRPDDRAGFVRMLRQHFAIEADERANETILRGAR